MCSNGVMGIINVPVPMDVPDVPDAISERAAVETVLRIALLLGSGVLGGACTPSEPSEPSELNVGELLLFFIAISLVTLWQVNNVTVL